MLSLLSALATSILNIDVFIITSLIALPLRLGYGVFAESTLTAVIVLSSNKQQNTMVNTRWCGRGRALFTTLYTYNSSTSALASLPGLPHFYFPFTFEIHRSGTRLLQPCRQLKYTVSQAFMQEGEPHCLHMHQVVPLVTDYCFLPPSTRAKE